MRRGPAAQAFLMLAVLLLSGCAENKADADEEENDGPGHGEEIDDPFSSEEDDGPAFNGTPTPFAQTFTMEMQAGILNGSNCIILSDQIEILHGNATLSWDADPLPMDLRFVIDSSSQFANVVGASPIRIDLAGIPRPSQSQLGWGFYFVVQEGTEPQVMHTVTMDMDFTYRGPGAVVAADNASCVR